MNNIVERVEEIVRPYLAQPAIGNEGKGNRYNTVSRETFYTTLFSIGKLYREELESNPDLYDAIVARLQKEIEQKEYKGSVKHF